MSQLHPQNTTIDRGSLTYFVTGVTRGLGCEMARRLAAEGHRVIGTVRDASSKPTLGEGVSILSMDLNELHQFSFAQPIDVLINNAGISDNISHDEPSPILGDLTATHVEQLIRTNAVGPLILTQALLPNLMMRATRRIVFMSSDLGSIGSNYTGGRYAYRASKAALNMIVKTLSVDLSEQGFIVVAIHPGWVRTDMGGINAPVEVSASVGAVLRTVASLRSDQNGAFLDRNASHLPW